MIRKGLLVLVNLLAGFLVLAVVLSATPGQASSVQRGGQGEVILTGDYQVAVSFSLDPGRPDRVAAVELEVTSAENLAPDALIQVSLDEGATWQRCTFESGKRWDCRFPPGGEPWVEAVTRVKVVIKS